MLIVIVPIPESRRATRKKLYAALRWAGFGNPSAGIWVTPHVERLPEAQSAIDSLGLHDNTMSFIGSPASVGVSEAELVERAWDLDEVARTYELCAHVLTTTSSSPARPHWWPTSN